MEDDSAGDLFLLLLLCIGTAPAAHLSAFPLRIAGGRIGNPKVLAKILLKLAQKFKKTLDEKKDECNTL